MINIKSNPEIIIPCACSCGVLRLVKDKEDGELYISAYKNDPDVANWRQKLRWIWSIIKNDIFADEIVIRPDDVKKLKKFFKDEV